jgi:hypothetical protein
MACSTGFLASKGERSELDPRRYKLWKCPFSGGPSCLASRGPSWGLRYPAPVRRITTGAPSTSMAFYRNSHISKSSVQARVNEQIEQKCLNRP